MVVSHRNISVHELILTEQLITTVVIDNLKSAGLRGVNYEAEAVKAGRTLDRSYLNQSSCS
jgi:hypothetical protein